MVLGLQGRAQLQSRYGRDAETMLSQPATKIFLRTTHPDAAEWASKTIGDVETERMKQSQQDGWARASTTSYGLERHVESLIMPSEIGGLANLRGYIKVGNLVSRLAFPYVDRLPVDARVHGSPPDATTDAAHNGGGRGHASIRTTCARGGDPRPSVGVIHAHHLETVGRRTSGALSRRRVQERPRQLLRPARSNRGHLARPVGGRVGTSSGMSTRPTFSGSRMVNIRSPASSWCVIRRRAVRPSARRWSTAPAGTRRSRHPRACR